MTEDKQRQLQQFVDAVRERLTFRLEPVSLKLLDLGLKKGKSEVITPGTEIYVVAGWVQRPATQEVKTFSMRFGAELGETTVEDVDPLCAAIVGSCVEQFFGKPVLQ